jgi:F-type H+-transporting ATPase subunit a
MKRSFRLLTFFILWILLFVPGLGLAEHLPEAVLTLDPATGKPSIWLPTITALITLGLLFLLAALGLTRLQAVPGGLQGAWEFSYEWLEEITVQVIGPEGPKLMWYFYSAFMFILFANLLGLFPYMASPTAKTDTTLALALCTFAVTHILGMKRKGILGYWGHYFHILDYSKESGVSKVITALLQFVLLPCIELIGELARPLSLTMRLFGNIYAKEMLLTILAFLVFDYFSQGTPGAYALMSMPLLLRPAILILGVLVSIIQAVVFTALSMIYIGGAIAVHAEHDEHGHAGDERGADAQAGAHA